VIGALKPWQLVFIGCGLPGLLVLALLFTVREPMRHGATATSPNATPGRDLFGAFLRIKAGTIIVILSAYVLFSLIQYSLTSWTPTMLTRRLHLTVPDSAFALGAVTIVVSPLAALTGGFLGDWMSKRWPDGRLRMAVLVAPIFLPGTLLSTLATDIRLAVLGMCLISASGTIIGTSVYATMQELAPDRYRGRMLAIYALAAGLLGMMLGAPLVALMTDDVFKDPARVNISMLSVTAPGAVIAFGLFWWGLRGFRRMRGERDA
jgi:MFS family permease